MVHGVAPAIRAEGFHDLQDLAGVIGLFQHDAGGGDTLLNARRIVDRIGEAGGTGQFAVDKARHEAQEFAAIARRHVGGRGENAALSQIILDRHRIGHGNSPYWS